MEIRRKRFPSDQLFHLIYHSTQLFRTPSELDATLERKHGKIEAIFPKTQE
jgi:hypothetical protein